MLNKTVQALVFLQISYICAKNCTLKEGITGECKLFEECPYERQYSANDTSCGSGTFPDVCCEAKPEDTINLPYGRITRTECEKLMGNYTDWKRYDFAFRLKTAAPREYLYIAALGYGSKDYISWNCSGGLISDKHVITSASCLNISNKTVKYVLLGDINLDKEDEFEKGRQTFTVVRSIPHPKFNSKALTVYHDIAILELDRNINRTEHVQPACLEWNPMRNDTYWLTLGWGDTLGIGSTYLERAEMTYYDQEQCQQAYVNETMRLPHGLEMTQFCGRGINDGIDTCLNDTGSPVTITNKHIRFEAFKGHVIIGITAVGHLCDGKQSPGVYTKVYPYLPWIESIVWPVDGVERVIWD